MEHAGAVPPVLPGRTVATVDGLLELLDAGRVEHDGEAVDLLGHALQCAAILERSDPEDLELQVAGLVHDVGTLLAPARPATHARTGAHAVHGLLGERVAALVAGHDDAKRYLVTVDARYRERLSARSIATLRSQGGLLNPEERRAFAARPYARRLLTLRRADDDAKTPGARTPRLEHWTLVLHEVAARACRIPHH